MSSFPFHPTDRKLEGLVGWDTALKTLFVYIIDTTKDEDDEGFEVFWAGRKRGEIVDVEVLDRMTKPYKAEGISPWMYAKLWEEAADA